MEIEKPQINIRSSEAGQFFETYRTVKVDANDMDACKIAINEATLDIYLGGPKGLSFVSFDSKTSQGRIKFSQKINIKLL